MVRYRGANATDASFGLAGQIECANQKCLGALPIGSLPCLTIRVSRPRADLRRFRRGRQGLPTRGRLVAPNCSSVVFRQSERTDGSRTFSQREVDEVDEPIVEVDVFQF